MAPELIRVEVACTVGGAAEVVELDLPHGATARSAVERARHISQLALPEIANARIGIFGVECAPDTLLRAGDRVEVYRPLPDDPKAKRRQRVARARKR
jgi:uncharacterized protein